MPKMKTKRAAAKRFKITGTGKVVGYAKNKRHLLGGQSSKVKRRRAGIHVASSADMQKISRMLPYIG